MQTFKQLLFLFAISLFIIGCSNDDDSATTKIFGTITFENADIWANWVDSGEVQVTVFPEFSLDPLAGWGAVPDNFFGPGVPGGTFAVGAPFNSQNPYVLEYSPGQSQYTYEIELDPGTYSAVAVGFRHDFVQDPSRRSATLGVYWNDPTMVSHGIVLRVSAGGGMIVPIYHYPEPSEFTIGEGKQLELNFRADFGFVNEWY
jgi:hypothetical protein